MLFNSWQFAVFFPLVAVAYFMVAYRFRWILLLVASYFFYMCAIPEYAVLLLSATTIDYCMGRAIASAESLRWKRAFLLLSLTANLGTLFFFKYFNFFMDSIESLGNSVGITLVTPHSAWLLPVGLSFYTFQTMSYSIDIYRGHLQPEKHFGRFALYVSFFPQLVAGPIERSTNLLPQFRQNFDFDYERIAGGLKLMAWGLFKKIVIADQLATLVDSVYGAPEHLTGVHYVMATVFFAFQIYCDFSGYSDIAIGAAQVFGYRLMLNFDRPYAARSVAEFWSRWHISLSTWFRDYLYIPLGGNRVAVTRWYLNLAIVFLISGLWHGTSWTYVTWGALHAFFLIFALATREVRQSLARRLQFGRFPVVQACLQRCVVFALICFAWIFFRADSMSDAMHIVTHLGTGWSHLFEAGWFRDAREQAGASKHYLFTSIVLVMILEFVQLYQSQSTARDWRQMFAGQHWLMRWSAYTGLVLAIVNLGAPKAAPFIYFQF
jgi:alginate O-acetyltransferase complex protein AlgI